MESSKLSVKFYVEESSQLKLADIVPVFHSWIQFHSIPDHLLIDVADYAHVPDGPGIVLVSHEANFYLDRFDSRLGLTYTRKPRCWNAGRAVAICVRRGTRSMSVSRKQRDAGRREIPDG
jgi:hypothetical protein